MECATRLRSMEMLLGIISFSPAKGRGEAGQLLMTSFFQRGSFPCVCHPWKSSEHSHSRFGTAGLSQQGLWRDLDITAVPQLYPVTYADMLIPCPSSAGHPSLLLPSAIHPDRGTSLPSPLRHACRCIKMGRSGTAESVAFGEAARCSLAISSGDDGWKTGNKLGMKCSSEGPGGNSCKNSAAAPLWWELCVWFFSLAVCGVCGVEQPAHCAPWPCPVQQVAVAALCASLQLARAGRS